MGITGIVLALPCCCPVLGLPFGIAAWVMGSSDLSEMNAGRMDASGRGTTQAGKVCGIISVPLAFVCLAVTIIRLPTVLREVMSEFGNP